MNIRKTIFKLALMCKSKEECAYCALHTKDGKCKLRYMTLMEIAKEWFGENSEEGTLWIRFKDLDAYNKHEDLMKDLLCGDGGYTVKVYIEETKVMRKMKLRADRYAAALLKEKLGEDQVKLELSAEKGQ